MRAPRAQPSSTILKVQLDQVKVQRRRNGGHAARTQVSRGESLLCVANFPANTGYAWDFIETLYAAISNRLDERGIATWVAYPAVAQPPVPLAGSAARAVQLEFSLSRAQQLKRVLAFVKQHNVRALYLCDQPAWHPAYVALRLAGVRWVVVHDHTSGERTIPRGPKRVLKRARRMIPGTVADIVIAVSDYVAARLVSVNLLPRDRVKRVWNSVREPAAAVSGRARLHATFGIAPDRPVIACACRATAEKGVAVLLRAFDRMQRADEGIKKPVLVYFGDGPILGDLKVLRDTLTSRADIVFAGYRADAADLIGDAYVCVVPSLWQEAFGLAALEPMLRGVPVIASRVGGIPEIIGDDEAGRLVDAGDEEKLAAAMIELLANPEERNRLGRNARSRALRLFSRETQIDDLCALIEVAFT